MGDAAPKKLDVVGFMNREVMQKFPGIKPNNGINFARQQTRESQADLQDPCKADILLGFNEANPSAGMCSKINSFMNQLAVAEYGNFTVALWSPSAFDKTYQYFFKQKLPVCVNQKKRFPDIEEHARNFWRAF